LYFARSCRAGFRWVILSIQKETMKIWLAWVWITFIVCALGQINFDASVTENLSETTGFAKQVLSDGYYSTSGTSFVWTSQNLEIFLQFPEATAVNFLVDF
jgi:hypothetical protein